jgi:hypothetical protein
MKIVIPMSSKDIHLLPSFLEVQDYLKVLADFPVVLVPSGATAFEAEGAADRLRLFCSSVSVMDVGYQELGQWPQGPNQHWIRTVYALAAAGNNDIWFWNELDCLPNQGDAYQVIKTAHGSGGKLFCGRIVDTPHRDGAGNIIKEKDDVMMMGCGVYPANMQMAPNFGPIAKGFIDGVNGEPFDKFIRWFAAKHGMSHTDAIGDRWNTGNYRLEDGVLKCDALPTEFASRDHSKTDIRNAVVIHGCKDDSLAKLVLDGYFEKSKATVSFAEAPQPVPASTLAAPHPEVTCGEFSALKLRVRRLEDVIESMTVATTMLPPRAITKADAVEQSKPDAIIKLESILKSGKGLRLADFATIANLSKEEARALAETEGYDVGKGSWLFKRAA